MTHKDFMISLQKYYGAYDNKYVGKMVLNYMIRYFSEDELDKILPKIFESFSNTYKTQPDIKIIEDITKKYNSKTGFEIGLGSGESNHGYFPNRKKVEAIEPPKEDPEKRQKVLEILNNLSFEKDFKKDEEEDEADGIGKY